MNGLLDLLATWINEAAPGVKRTVWIEMDKQIVKIALREQHNGKLNTLDVAFAIEEVKIAKHDYAGDMVREAFRTFARNQETTDTLLERKRKK